MDEWMVRWKDGWIGGGMWVGGWLVGRVNKWASMALWTS